MDKNATPKAYKPYQIPETLKSTVSRMLQLVSEKWVEDTNSPWAAPIIPVLKPDKSIRLCMDYRALNSVTPQIQYPIPLLGEMLSKVCHFQYLSQDVHSKRILSNSPENSV